MTMITSRVGPGPVESRGIRTTLSAVIAAIGVWTLLAGVPAGAHHSFASMFDIARPIRLRGEVTKLEWMNPHVWIHIDVPGPDGSRSVWAIEGGLPIQLTQRGLTPDSLLPGTEIVVEGYQARDGTQRASGGYCTLPDGRTVFLSFSLVTADPRPSDAGPDRRRAR